MHLTFYEPVFFWAAAFVLRLIVMTEAFSSQVNYPIAAAAATQWQQQQWLWQQQFQFLANTFDTFNKWQLLLPLLLLLLLLHFSSLSISVWALAAKCGIKSILHLKYCTRRRLPPELMDHNYGQSDSSDNSNSSNNDHNNSININSIRNENSHEKVKQTIVELEDAATDCAQWVEGGCTCCCVDREE